MSRILFYPILKYISIRYTVEAPTKIVENKPLLLPREVLDSIINKLEVISESKYKIGDYKGSIKAIRRAEKYY